MEAHLVRLAPLLLIDVVGGLVGFLIALGWWKASGRTMDRDAVMFITASYQLTPMVLCERVCV